MNLLARCELFCYSCPFFPDSVIEKPSQIEAADLPSIHLNSLNCELYPFFLIDLNSIT